MSQAAPAPSPPPAYSSGDYQTGPYPITQLPAYEVPRPRRNLKPLWITLSIVLVVVLVAGGGYALYRYRAEQQIQAEQATVALPDKLADLAKSDDVAFFEPIEAMMAPLQAQPALTHVVGSGYDDPTDAKQTVVIVAASGQISNPEQEVRTLFAQIKDTTVGNVTDYPPGPLGGHVRCGGIEDGSTLTVCGWADHGTLGLGMFHNRPIEESALLFVRIRQEVVTR